MPIKTAEFDRLFDEGGDISEHLDWSKAARPNREPRRVNVDFPPGWSKASTPAPPISASPARP